MRWGARGGQTAATGEAKQMWEEGNRCQKDNGAGEKEQVEHAAAAPHCCSNSQNLVHGSWNNWKRTWKTQRSNARQLDGQKTECGMPGQTLSTCATVGWEGLSVIVRHTVHVNTTLHDKNKQKVCQNDGICQSFLDRINLPSDATKGNHFQMHSGLRPQ